MKYSKTELLRIKNSSSIIRSCPETIVKFEKTYNNADLSASERRSVRRILLTRESPQFTPFYIKLKLDVNPYSRVFVPQLVLANGEKIKSHLVYVKSAYHIRMR